MRMESLVQFFGNRIAPKIVRVRVALLAQSIEFAAPFGDQLVFVCCLSCHCLPLLQSLLEAGLDEGVEAAVQYCLSVTGFDPVRKSLMRLWSST